MFTHGLSTKYLYFDNSGDQRLQEIQNLGGTGVISQFDYTYTAVGNVLTWSQSNSGATSGRQYTMGYDRADQLISALLEDSTNGSVVKDLSYGYDFAGNRTVTQDGNLIATASMNPLNQQTMSSGGGMMRFAGKVNKSAKVTVGGNAAVVQASDNSFEGYAAVSAGATTQVHIVAKDVNGDTTDKYVNVTPTAVPTRTLFYDLEGNMTSQGPFGAPEVTYGWDAANRLVTITKGADTTRFEYDGLGRRVCERHNEAVIKRWVWSGLELCEERDLNNAVTKRFYPQGEQIAGASYYYTRDHLGSIRELVDTTGAVLARYDYDPYGQRSNLITSNPIKADFGFTGHYFHAASGLHLAPYRAYDASLGRWLSRDPIGENGGLNLYGYVGNSPTNQVDPLGLDAIPIAVPAGSASRNGGIPTL